MEIHNSGVERTRRAGTFTFGLVLVLSGLLMLTCMFYPRFDFWWLLRLSPLMLISLGVEVLLAAHGGGKVRYDWVGMLLCIVIVSAALLLSAASWWLMNAPSFDGNRTGDEKSLSMEYWNFNRSEERQYLDFLEGESLSADISNQSGTVSVSLYKEENWETVYEKENIGRERLDISVPTPGRYCLQIRGTHARGAASFQVS